MIALILAFGLKDFSMRNSVDNENGIAIILLTIFSFC